MTKPDLVLREILRQEGGSGIIDFAHVLRRGATPTQHYDWQEFSDVSVIGADDLTTETLASADRVICGFNVTRCAINRIVREARGYTGPLVVGDEVICLKNDRERGLFNGMLLTVTTIHHTGDADVGWLVDCVSDIDVKYGMLEMRPEKFGHLDRDEQDIFDYGYAVTCHKYQGSQADRIVVIEEGAGWDQRRWRYTAATRAAKHLTWVVK